MRRVAELGSLGAAVLEYEIPQFPVFVAEGRAQGRIVSVDLRHGVYLDSLPIRFGVDRIIGVLE